MRTQIRTGIIDVRVIAGALALLLLMMMLGAGQSEEEMTQRQIDIFLKEDEEGWVHQQQNPRQPQHEVHSVVPAARQIRKVPAVSAPTPSISQEDRKLHSVFHSSYSWRGGAKPLPSWRPPHVVKALQTRRATVNKEGLKGITGGKPVKPKRFVLQEESARKGKKTRHEARQEEEQGEKQEESRQQEEQQEMEQEEKKVNEVEKHESEEVQEKEQKQQDNQEGMDEKEEQVQQGAASEKYLLLPAVQVGFASGIRTAILPFLMLAAAVGRIAVLTPMQFGIPAFRSGSDPQFLDMGDFIDMENLLSHLPCVRTVSYAEWKRRTRATVDTLLELGNPEEIGMKGGKGTGKADPSATPFQEACIVGVQGIDRPPSKKTEPGPYWAGTFGHANEILFLHQSEGMVFKNTACVSLHAALSARKAFSHVESQKSVMIFNVPGMVRGPFVAGGGTMKGVTKMFLDVPNKNLCKKEGYDKMWPDFRKWPALAPTWVSFAKRFIEKELGGDTYACAQIRGEKMVLRAVASKKLASVQELRQDDTYMGSCVQGMIEILKEQDHRKLFLVTDMDPKTGSPSARRSRTLTAWQNAAFRKLKDAFPDSVTYCASDRHISDKKGEGDSTVTRVLAAYDGNCAIAETAVCRSANKVIRFGTGSMGDFVVGDSAIDWYKTCDDVVSRRAIHKVGEE